MAYAWTAQYGYFSDSTQPAEDLNNLEGLFFNDSRFHFSTPKTLYTIPESLTLPAPTNSRTRVNLDTAMARSITLTDWNYITVIPFCHTDVMNRLTHDGYIKWEMTLLELCGGALYYSLGLLEDAFSIRNTQHSTWVYLNDINILIDWQGAVYTVDPDSTIITRVIAPGFYFKNTLEYTTEQADNPFHYHDCQGHAYFVFIYDGGFYQNGIDIIYAKRNVAPNDEIKEYIIFNDGNYRSPQTNNLINYLIGTPEDPKYKYKTDPANPETDPYIPPLSPSTPSKPGGGEGTHDPNPGNDPAPIPDITQMTSILDTEFMTAYKMTATGLKNLGSFLWSQNFYGVIANVLSSPFDVIIGLHIVPVAPTIEDSARTILLGNVDSLIAARRVTSQYVEKDLGGFDVPHIWGAYLDYQGKFEIFLPFIGFRSIAADDIVGHEIRVKYHIDVITGACIAYVLTDNYVTYTFAGSCSYNIPITGQNFTNIVSSMIQTAGTIGMAAIAPEGMGAAGAMAVAGSSLNTAMTKPTYSRSGGMGGNSGFMGMRTPVLIARVPNVAIPGNQNKITGYPSFITRKLSELSGYTEVYKVHLEGIGATDTEKAEIERALMEGVEL